MHTSTALVKSDPFDFTTEIQKVSVFQLGIRRFSLPMQRVLKRSRSLRIKKYTWSSGNFGSAGARSAPSTPQDASCPPPGACLTPDSLQAALIPAGCPQASPSHSVFSKCDKTSLKHLSTSTPAMTAQAQLTEPPSPKTTKDPKIHTTSKSRQKKFLRHFPNVEEDEKILNYYSCALIGDILLQGNLYITTNYFAFYSNVFGYVTKLLIPILTVENITKEKTAKIIPNAVGVKTSEDKHIFGSLMSRDSTLLYMKTVWQKAKCASPVIIEPEIEEPDIDSSDSADAESGRDSPPIEMKPKFPLMKSLIKEPLQNQSDAPSQTKDTKTITKTLKDTIIEFRKLPRQSLILCATTLLLILLFFSAGVLLHRISQIQTRYSSAMREGAAQSSDDVYNHLLQWHSQLHSKSAGAVNNFLDTNLDLISQVRQSLEALSSVLVQNSQETRREPDNRPREVMKDGS
ncbi:unnamed protein product [Phaedon cochleariae]|uniref:GRAM domain-containing protein n=1 Tax=Phaedon cochleariae TaxID=80249 RepID=A0A9P0GPC5_PHACE|nr:unnamed protein product [Phaedon cochleariae]